MSVTLNKLRVTRDFALKRLRDALVCARNALKEPEYISRFETWCSRIESFMQSFTEAQVEIICQLDDDEDKTNEMSNQEQADDMFCEILEIQNKMFPKFKPPPPGNQNASFSNASTSSVLNSSHFHSHVKLPPISLPNFSGKLKEFPAFMDLFNTLVHNRNDLSNVQKFQYLLTCLSGEPINVIRAFPIADANYMDAYDALNIRYSDKRYLAFLCWEEIINAKSISSNSVQNLRKLLDVFNENLAILKSLGLPTINWSFILFHTLLTKIDKRSRECFEIHSKSCDFPSFTELRDFLSERCKALERSMTTQESQSAETTPVKRIGVGSTNKIKPALMTLSSQITQPCAFCKENHPMFMCPEFLAKSAQERIDYIKDNKYCINCLRTNHTISQCKSVNSCKHCGKRHNSVLHLSQNKSKESALLTQSQSTPENDTSLSNRRSDSENYDNDIPKLVTSLNNTVPSSKLVLLATAEVEMKDAWGNYQTVRIILDSGSQCNIISDRCSRRLGLKRCKVNTPISGVGQVATNSNIKVFFEMRSKGDNKSVFTGEAISLEKICGDMPTYPIKQFGHLSNIRLADSRYFEPRPIDVLIGGELFPKILLPGKIEDDKENNVATAVNTVFGWILMGKASLSNNPLVTTSSLVQSLHLADDTCLELAMQKLWEVEDVPVLEKPHYSKDDQLCERIYKNTHSRDDVGRYIVHLPFRDSIKPTFQDSHSIALRRFHHLEKRLLTDPLLYKDYKEQILDYIQTDQMEEVPPDQCKSPTAYYIPHHAVVKPDRLTTKLRVVYDASTKDGSGHSLNDNLLTGCKLQADIFDVLLRFRLHCVVLTADIKQMYRRIIVTPEDRDFQRILFRWSPNESVKEFRINRVTFGVSSAPFLAIRTMHQLAADEEQSFPLASAVIRNDLYVDDVVTGCHSTEEALEIHSQLIRIMMSGGFELRKWSSNDETVLNHVPEEHRAIPNLAFDANSNFLKVLGLEWHASLDTFVFHTNPIQRECTKRTMLSELARIFDPIGFLTPISFLAKSLIQKLWFLGIPWDYPAPEEICHTWNKYIEQLSCLSEIQIDRRVTFNDAQQYEIHGFGDASESGYAAVVYLCCTTINKDIHVKMLCAKSRVAPVKRRLTLPRLELCAASLLANLMHYINERYSKHVHISRMVAWSDSTIVLSWLKSSASNFKTFVGNRIANIHHKIPTAEWKHISSKQNPADCASRGLLPKELIQHQLWWRGPPWLVLNHQYWPSDEVTITDAQASEILNENRPHALITRTNEMNVVDRLIQKYSSLRKIERIVAYILRFFNNISRSRDKIEGHLTETELYKALLFIIKRVQSSVFQNEIYCLQHDKVLPKSFRKLQPFLDQDNVVRVGGRLSNSSLSYDTRHPALLPCKHIVTKLIIQKVHNENFHPGLQTLQFILSQNFWILAPKRAIRHVISNCFKCFRSNPTTFQPMMANLPSSRVNQTKAFQCVGCDYAGPFSIILHRYRGVRTVKAYLCIFVCFTTKAVHLELASDLSTEAFLAALRRFIGRRGRCNIIHSDCGTNFKGAEHQLSPLMKEACKEEKIEFKFNPPSAPHFGGLWEAGVKSVKTHLYRVVGSQTLTYEEFNTLLVQIESILNSRPLCPVSSDPTDLSVLTPGHFLTLAPLTSLPTPGYSNVSLNRLTRWQLIQRMHQDFWSRWHKEYLCTLSQRLKWTKSIDSVKIGQIVIIKNELTHPLRWRFGRIIKLYPGTDGIPRVASVHTVNGAIERPLVKLCPIPHDDN